jgi:hypothetical protein
MKMRWLLLLLLASCADDSHLWPADLWSDTGVGRIEDRELLGRFTMEGDTCYLRLKNGSVSHIDDYFRKSCYGRLFEQFVRKAPAGHYAWGESIKGSKAAMRITRK